MKVQTKIISYNFLKLTNPNWDRSFAGNFYIIITSNDPSDPVYQWKIGYETNQDIPFIYDTKLSQSLIAELEEEYQKVIKEKV